MDNPAKLEHIVAAFERPLTTDETRVVPNWLDRAWRELNRVIPGLEARNSLELGNPAYLKTDNIRDVLVSMVERKLRNPDGRVQWNGDDYGEKVDASLASGRIYVTASEIESLSPPEPSFGQGIYSIPLSR